MDRRAYFKAHWTFSQSRLSMENRLSWLQRQSKVTAGHDTCHNYTTSCLHCYSFPAYFQSRDYCDAELLIFCRLRFCRPQSRIEVDFVANVYEALHMTENSNLDTVWINTVCIQLWNKSQKVFFRLRRCLTPKTSFKHCRQQNHSLYRVPQKTVHVCLCCTTCNLLASYMPVNEIIQYDHSSCHSVTVASVGMYMCRIFHTYIRETYCHVLDN